MVRDKSTHSTISVAVWGAQAESFEFKVGNIIELEKCKLTSYSARSLSVLWCTIMKKIETYDNKIHQVLDLFELKEEIVRKRSNLEEKQQQLPNKFFRSS